MIFEIWKDGERKFYTDSPKCIPSAEQLKDMKKHGYKIKEKK